MIGADRYFTDEELYAAAASSCRGMLFDVENFTNYFLVSFMHVETKKIVYFEQDETLPLQIDWIRWILNNFCMIGFNSRPYDAKILSAALAGQTLSDLKQCTNDIILENMKTDELKEKYAFNMIEFNHIDLIEVAPLPNISLKTYGARLHCKHLQDLPYDPDATLTREEKNHVRQYNFNDLENTWLIFKAVENQLNLRAAMSAEYGIDLRSKSDAQIAEAVIGAEIKRLTGKTIKRPKVDPDKVYKYKCPQWLSFKTPALQAQLEAIKAADFCLDDNGVVRSPSCLRDAKIEIGQGVYRMGIGGLHSSEKNVAHVADDEYLLIDRDVASYYPSIMLQQGLYPVHMGEAFLDVFRFIVDRRLVAKKNKDVIGAESLKITTNGTFGKLGSPYSILYSPDLLIQVTVTGQLALLMQIEMMHNVGIEAISANTDGVVYKCPVKQEWLFQETIQFWEQHTEFKTEETRYKGVYSRDVNNYIAVQLNGKIKAKGEYTNPWDDPDKQIFRLFTNPGAIVCIDAAVAAITKGKQPLDTILACKSIERFVSVNKVTGGAHKDGRYLGKTVRWYYANGVRGAIERVRNGNKVPLTDGGKPCMGLPDTFPTDINYDWYVENTICILEDVGFYKRRNQQLKLF
jgi:hypothetical protein